MTRLAATYLGVLVNHLVEDCPIRARSRPELERCDWWHPCLIRVDPDRDDGLCGWCVRVWRARNPLPETAQPVGDGHAPGGTR